MDRSKFIVIAVVLAQFAFLSAAVKAESTLVFDNKTGEQLYISVAEGMPPVGRIAAVLPVGSFPVKISVSFNIGHVFVFTPSAIATYVKKQKQLAEQMAATPGVIRFPALISSDLAKFLNDFNRNSNTLVLATLAGTIGLNDGAYMRPLSGFVATKDAKGALVFRPYSPK